MQVRIFLINDTEARTPAVRLSTVPPDAGTPQIVLESWVITINEGSDPQKLVKCLNAAGGFADLPY